MLSGPLSDRRKAIEFAALVGLFWGAFLFWGLRCLHAASGFVTESQIKSITVRSKVLKSENCFYNFIKLTLNPEILPYKVFILGFQS